MSPGGNSYGLGPASYDVRLDQRVVLPPRGFVLGSTLERFCMPNDLAGTVRDKSTLARCVISTFNTFLDPGWAGFLTLEIVNHSEKELVIDAGEPIAQIVFEMLDEPTEQPYRGKYYDQERGPQPARRDMRRVPLDELELSVRVVNCLRAAEITTVGELVVKTEGELLRLLGYKRLLNEVRQALATMGLHLGMPPAP